MKTGLLLRKGMKIRLFLVLTVFLTGLSACASQNGKSGSPQNREADDPEPIRAEYHKTSQEEAKKIMDSGEVYTLLDVRTQPEYDEKHIVGAMLIPDQEIRDRAARELPDKDALILVYCRSGARSKNAAEILVALGYTDVRDIGGINTWPYDTETVK